MLSHFKDSMHACFILYHKEHVQSFSLTLDDSLGFFIASLYQIIVIPLHFLVANHFYERVLNFVKYSMSSNKLFFICSIVWEILNPPYFYLYY